jgi:hypothetical protein
MEARAKPQRAASQFYKPIISQEQVLTLSPVFAGWLHHDATRSPGRFLV